MTRAKSDCSLAMADPERTQLERRFTEAREEALAAGRSNGPGEAPEPAPMAGEPSMMTLGEPSGAPASMGRLTRAEALEALDKYEEQWKDEPAAYSDETISCYHQHLGGSNHGFKYEVTIDSDPGPVVAIARELDLMPTWHKFVTQAKLVEKINADKKDRTFGGLWGYVEIWFPWPLSNRAMVVKCETLDCLEERGALLIELLSGDYEEGKLPTTADQCPRLWVKNLTKIVPLPPKPDGTPRSQFTLFCETDFQTPLTPKFLINFILKVMAPVVYSQVKELLESSFGGNSQFRSRMEETPEMYGAIKESVEVFQSAEAKRQRELLYGEAPSVRRSPVASTSEWHMSLKHSQSAATLRVKLDPSEAAAYSTERNHTANAIETMAYEMPVKPAPTVRGPSGVLRRPAARPGLRRPRRLSTTIVG
eukprot:CAMPEP_0182564412 /NCGR_PEP_ID=MMETSP1324-20130603/6361_1 /TAXON_ID=236786 /ORGANISM="Florenciella sp., Strain RCC1587" /LENGTH=421 /DNA_ID=CAMNT_0024777873 /DNA_START=22 /DNA_END=1287 /DNA_ORIENTATION=-